MPLFNSTKPSGRADDAPRPLVQRSAAKLRRLRGVWQVVGMALPDRTVVVYGHDARTY